MCLSLKFKKKITTKSNMTLFWIKVTLSLNTASIFIILFEKLLSEIGKFECKISLNWLLNLQTLSFLFAESFLFSMTTKLFLQQGIERTNFDIESFSATFFFATVILDLPLKILSRDSWVLLSNSKFSELRSFLQDQRSVVDWDNNFI